jgi:hypothetical protein
MPVIPALRRLRQEDCKFKVSLAYIVRPCLKKLVQKNTGKFGLTAFQIFINYVSPIQEFYYFFK